MEWKPIKNYEDLYEISNEGEVRHIAKNRTLTQTVTNKGYVLVSLYKDRKIKHCTVHRLVAEHFISNPENKPQVNHINGIKTDNHISNLEWVTNEENYQHALQTGLTTLPKLTIEDVKWIRANVKPGDPVYGIQPLARLYNMNTKHMREIIQRKYWKSVD